MAVVVDRFVRRGPVAVAAAAGLLLLLVAYALSAFPVVGDPHQPESWLNQMGSDRLRWTGLAFALLLTGAYAGVAVAALRTRAAFDRWAGVGLATGIAAGLLAATAGAISALVARTPQELLTGQAVAQLLFVATPPAAAAISAALSVRRPWSVFLAGVAVALLAAAVIVGSGLFSTLYLDPSDREPVAMGQLNVGLLLGLLFLATPLAVPAAGRALAGRLATSAFWAAVAFALLAATAGLVSDLALASHLAHTAWIGDPWCTSLPASQLAGCEIGYDLRGMSEMLWLAPLPGATMLGIVLLARTALGLQSAEPGPLGRVAMSPVLLGALMLALLLALHETGG